MLETTTFVDFLLVYAVVGGLHGLVVALLSGIWEEKEEPVEMVAFATFLWPAFYLALLTGFAYIAGVRIRELLTRRLRRRKGDG